MQEVRRLLCEARYSASEGKSSMEDSKAQLSSGYAMGPPWLFKGSALYQLHLVKAEVARVFIPKEFKLVEAFGYTLGGFFLAHYDDSPVAKFDELVVIAGTVWNPPTSCAWAARVLVNNEEACRHGRKEFGLPSNVGIFSKQKSAEVRVKSTNKYSSFLNMIGINSSSRKEHTEVKISEVNDSNIMSLCSISVPYLGPKLQSDDKWMGPKIRMSLPNFSGRTIHNPLLLKYACQIECRNSSPREDLWWSIVLASSCSIQGRQAVLSCSLLTWRGSILPVGMGMSPKVGLIYQLYFEGGDLSLQILSYNILNIQKS